MLKARRRVKREEENNNIVAATNNNNIKNAIFVPTHHYELIPPVLCNLFKSNINNENLNDFTLIQQNLSNLKSFFSTTDVNLPPLDVQEEIFKQILDIYALQLDLEIKLLPKQLNACHFYILKLIDYLPKFLYFENRSELFCGYNPNSKDPENRNVLNKFKFKKHKEFNWLYHIFNNLNYDTSLKLLEYYCNLYYLDLKLLFNRELLNANLIRTRSNVDDGKKIRIENSLLKNYFNIYTNSERDLSEFILDYFNYLSQISVNDDIELKLRNISLLVKAMICVASLNFDYDYSTAKYNSTPFVTKLFENFDYNDKIVTQIKCYILQFTFQLEGDDTYNYYILNDCLLSNSDKLFFLFYLLRKCLRGNISLNYNRIKDNKNNFITLIGIVKNKKLQNGIPISYFLTLIELIMRLFNATEIGETIMKEESMYKKEKKQFIQYLDNLMENQQRGEVEYYEKDKFKKIKEYLGIKKEDETIKEDQEEKDQEDEEEQEEEDEEIVIIAGGDYGEEEDNEDEVMEEKAITEDQEEDDDIQIIIEEDEDEEFVTINDN
ncbi:hypothetical protein ABK040_016012 [Willaertia magna]